MAYVPVPKDLNAVKTKVMFNLTKRQLICFGSGAAVAVPLFFLCKKVMDTSVASLIMIIVLFFSKGIMGDKELSWEGIGGALEKLKAKLSKKKTAEAEVEG